MRLFVNAISGYEEGGLSALGVWLYLDRGHSTPRNQMRSLGPRGWYRSAPLALEAIRRVWIFGERHNFGFFSN